MLLVGGALEAVQRAYPRACGGNQPPQPHPRHPQAHPRLPQGRAAQPLSVELVRPLSPGRCAPAPWNSCGCPCSPREGCPEACQGRSGAGWGRSPLAHPPVPFWRPPSPQGSPGEELQLLLVLLLLPRALRPQDRGGCLGGRGGPPSGPPTPSFGTGGTPPSQSSCSREAEALEATGEEFLDPDPDPKLAPPEGPEPVLPSVFRPPVASPTPQADPGSCGRGPGLGMVARAASKENPSRFMNPFGADSPVAPRCPRARPAPRGHRHTGP